VPSARGRLTTIAFRAGSRLAQALPASVATPVGRVVGGASAWVMPGPRRMAARHQRRAAPDAGTAEVRGVFESYGRYWVEMLRLPALKFGSGMSNTSNMGNAMPRLR